MAIKEEEQNKNGMKVVDNMDGEKSAEDKLNMKVSGLDKSRVRQLMLLREEAESKGDSDKVKEIDAELLKMCFLCLLVRLLYYKTLSLILKVDIDV
jgi:hypothetical protein